MQNFVYLVGDRTARECVVVDPAWEIDTIVRTAEADGMRITGALITHTHQDHIGGSLAEWGMPGRIPGVEELLARVPARVYVHRAERGELRGFGSDLVQVESAMDLPVGGNTVTFIHTPGHTPGSQCFLVDGHLISGDTLFIRSCGRTDLPGGDPAELHFSLTQRLGRLPDDTVLLPGPQLRGGSLDPRRRARGEPLRPDGPGRLPPADGRRPHRFPVETRRAPPSRREHRLHLYLASACRIGRRNRRRQCKPRSPMRTAPVRPPEARGPSTQPTGFSAVFRRGDDEICHAAVGPAWGSGVSGAARRRTSTA